MLPTAADTHALGRALGAAAPPGSWLLIGGDLGVGKTTLIRGVAAGMGAEGSVTSPTFVLVHEHPCPEPPQREQGQLLRPRGLVHADLYRVKSGLEAEQLALAEYADDGWVVAVEWPERWPAMGEDGALRLSLSGSGDGPRVLLVHAMAEWAAAAIASVRQR